MSPVTAQIIDKLQRIEQVSPTTLEFILDFVSYLESRLELNSETNQDAKKTYFDLDNLDAAYAEMAAEEERESEAREWIEADEATQETTASFLLGLVDSFQEDLMDEDLADLLKDGSENYDHYLYNWKLRINGI